MKKITLFVLAFALSLGLANAQLIRITEAMSSSGTGGTADWVELTNLGQQMSTLQDGKSMTTVSYFQLRWL